MSYVDQKIEEAAKAQAGYGERARANLRQLQQRRGYHVEQPPTGRAKEPERVSVECSTRADPGARSHWLRIGPDTYERTHETGGAP